MLLDTVRVIALDTPITGFGGDPLIDDRKQIVTLGDVLLRLVGAMHPQSSSEAILAYRLCEHLRRAQKAGRPFRATESAVNLLRVATRQNALQYVGIVLGQIWEALGTGESTPVPEVEAPPDSD